MDNYRIILLICLLLSSCGTSKKAQVSSETTSEIKQSELTSDTSISTEIIERKHIIAVDEQTQSDNSVINETIITEKYSTSDDGAVLTERRTENRTIGKHTTQNSKSVTNNDEEIASRLDSTVNIFSAINDEIVKRIEDSEIIERDRSKMIERLSLFIFLVGIGFFGLYWALSKMRKR